MQPPGRQDALDDRRAEQDRERDGLHPTVRWCRNCANVLHREKQTVTRAMQTGMNLYRGDTPWWKDRPKWKMSTRLQEPFFVATQWTAILSDNKPRVTYNSQNPAYQRTADIATAAFYDAYAQGGWQQTIRNTILLSRIQKKAFLRLTYDKTARGGQGQAKLIPVTGEQVYVDKNAMTVPDAQVLLYETRLSYGEIVAQFPKVRAKLQRKSWENRQYDDNRAQDILSPPTSMNFPSQSGATPPYSASAGSVNNPPYSAQATSPDGEEGTSGIKVQEFWTKPHKTVFVPEITFSASGEPQTTPKEIEYEDGEVEAVRRVWTEGMVVYELPQSVLDLLNEAMNYGGPAVLNDTECYDVVKEHKAYPLYPEGRLTTIIDGDILAEDRMNPLGYVPFIPIDAYPDGVNFWGISDLDIIADPYEYEVRLVTSMLDAAHLTSNPIWRLPISSEVSDDDITNAPGSIQREDIMSLRYGKREPGPDMPNYVMQLLQYVDAKIQKLTGLNDIMMGGSKGKAQQSTDSMTMQQENAGVRFRDAAHNVEYAMQVLGEQFLQMMSRFYTTPELISIKDANGNDEPVSVLGTHFDMPLRVEAKPGSAQPSPTARLNMLLNLLNNPKPVVDVTEIWSVLQELGVITSASALERRIERDMKNPDRSWRITMPNTDGGKQPKKPNSKRQRSGLAG
jgi:hypothetical protein